MPDRWEELEPDRHELREALPYRFELDRREFVAATGAGLLLVVTGCSSSGATPKERTRLHIGTDGVVTVFSSKVEFGQGSRTQLSQAVAEELRIGIDSVRMVLADTDQTPDDGATAGSRTTPSTVPRVRKAAAAARELLQATAAKSWGVDPTTLEVENGIVRHNGNQLSYADLAANPSTAATDDKSIPAGVSVRATAAWTTLGNNAPKVQSREVVTGQHRYPSDIVRPGMLYGKILRAPAYAATLKSLDESALADFPAVQLVRDGEFVGCVAPTSFEAREAVAKLAESATWEFAPHVSSDEVFDHFKEHAVIEGSGRRGPRISEKVSDAAAGKTATTTLEARYTTAYIQHAPMEPRAAVAEWVDGRLTVWTGTQRPNGVRSQLEETFRRREGSVRVIVPDSGGGFGGKHTGEVAIEAARLSKAVGKPVWLRWTREEEFTWAYFRPAGLFEMQAGIDGEGKIVNWDFTTYNAGASSITPPYVSPAVRTAYYPSDSPVRHGSYRGIAATTNNFARECFIDELATAAGIDPLEFRLKNLDDERMIVVLKTAAERFGWRQNGSTGIGIACGTEKGSYVATCAEVTIDSGEIRIVRLVEVFECGAVQNPRNLRAQVEGSVIQGIGGALYEGVRFANGRLENNLFSRYRVPRFGDVPPIETVLLDRDDLPSAGGGETPIISVAPAIANAVFAATGKRLRQLPLQLPV
jgi:CO/xanthine dehydrogenase Mo-binding subunit